jgi:predicted Rossmann fold flavoprotein
MKRDVIIIGGGAAGLMCAIEAGKRGRAVLLLEHAERLGKKILISGGGRCNFTNVNAGPENYLSANPDFCKSALARFTPGDFIALVEKHGIPYHEKKLGQLFCDFSSRQIVELLQKECEAAGVEIQLGCGVGEVSRGAGFKLETNQGMFECDSLVIATGGLSFPKIGATDFGYRIARQFGVKLTATEPGLVPLTFGAEERAAFGQLSGISVDAEVSTASGARFRESILFTHGGLSGPAILQISNYRRNGEPIFTDLLPDRPASEIFAEHRQGSKELKNVLGQLLPQRFVAEWCARCAASRPMNRYSTKELEEIAGRLHRWEIRPEGTEGYGKAEVTLGGVDTAELSSKTMESRRAPGLYFIGEVVDVTGWLGGYNFQWAWASGHAAGRVV